jgi:hypothetical protein
MSTRIAKEALDALETKEETNTELTGQDEFVAAVNVYIPLVTAVLSASSQNPNEALQNALNLTHALDSAFTVENPDHTSQKRLVILNIVKTAVECGRESWLAPQTIKNILDKLAALNVNATSTEHVSKASAIVKTSIYLEAKETALIVSRISKSLAVLENAITNSTLSRNHEQACLDCLYIHFPDAVRNARNSQTNIDDNSAIELATKYFHEIIDAVALECDQ